MDVQTLTNLFATTYSTNPNLRRAAELEIRKIGGQEGMMTAIMQIINNNALDLPVRQACAVYLKNRVQKSYQITSSDGKSDQAPIPPSDRVAIKQSILPLLVAAPSRAIRVQLAACVKSLVASDFPEEWPELLDTVVGLISSDDLATVYGGLVVNLEIIKAFKYRAVASTDILPVVITRTFPILVNIGQKLASPNIPPPISPLEAAEFLHLIIKTYKLSTMTGLSPHQQSRESIMPWGTLLFQVVGMQLPAGVALPGGPDDWEKHAWWKAKKWAYGTLNRLFERYGNPTHIPKPMQREYGAFANHFVEAFAPEIFKIYLQQVEPVIGNHSWMSKKCLNLIFSFFGACVKPKSTWSLLKPHYQTLVARFIFPQLRFDDERKELWQADQVDYVRLSLDEFEDYSSPKSAAVAFLLGLATTRRKTTFMGILGFINEVLKGSPSPEDKYAALTMIVALSEVIMSNQEVKPAMEDFCMNLVLPEFSSPYGFLREIACQVIGHLSSFKLEWKNSKNHEAVFHAIVKAIDDPELAVRVQAALSLAETLGDEQVRQALTPGIEKIMHDLFKLSDETDLDALTNCMECFIEAFREQLFPVSPQLIARLSQSYTRLLSEQQAKAETKAETDEDLRDESITNIDTDDKTFALMGIMKTIMAILTSFDEVENSKSLIGDIQEALVPLILLTLQADIIELYDGAWELVDALTFRSRSISPSLWPIFEITYKLFKGPAIDYLEEMLPGLCNFLLFGKEGFIQHPEYIRMALDIFVTSVTNDHLGENDGVNGCKLAESVLLNLRGHVDDAIPTIVNTAQTILSRPPQSKALKLAALGILITTVFYNPLLALNALGQTPGGARGFFDKWFVAVNAEKGLPRVHDKKLSIVTLCDLLKLDPAAIPEGLKDGWVGIVGGILNVFKGLPEALEKRDALLSEFQEDNSDDELDMDDAELLNNVDAADEDADVWDEETAYLDLLAEEGARLRAKQAARVAKAAKTETLGEGAAEGDEDEDEESDVESINEDLGIETPIDEVDPYGYFKQTLTSLQTSNPSLYQVNTTSLSVDQQAILMEVMAHSENPEEDAQQ
ncbi:hypothetical protein FRC03_002380 [Tulasnella sp. 419]|nr:hypothetical protein FRC02_008663 [Tulasnella sp. 418]KAG8969519.1 hypothetical protein FRC03_002380 [Tulasnella sp. 419]